MQAAQHLQVGWVEVPFTNIELLYLCSSKTGEQNSPGERKRKQKK